MMRTARRLLLAIVALSCMAAGLGCETELETGYKPRSLSATPAQRRGYYASPFTPEAAAADQVAPSGPNFHKPGAY